MKGLACIFLIWALLAGASEAITLKENLQTSIKCFHSVDYRFFDLKPLMKDGDGYYSIGFKGKDNLDYKIDLDFWESLPEAQRCTKTNDVLAVESKTQISKAEFWKDLTQNSGKGESAKLVETDNQDNEHLILKYATDNVWQGDEKYELNIEVFCDSKFETPVLKYDETKSTECKPYINVTSKNGCKVGDLNGLWRFVEDNLWIFAIVFMVVGAFSLVLGRKLIKPTLFIFGTLATVATILFLFYVLILPNDVKKWVGWVILSVSVILGCIVGFFAAKLVRVGVFILGVWGGAGIALILNNTVFYKINSVAVLWIMIAVFGIVLGVLSFIWFDYIVIVCTSILGGYLLIRGISLVAGGYPNEFTVYERIKANDLSGVPGTFYAYLAGMVILIAIGIFIQIRIKRRAKKSTAEYDYYKKV